MRISVRPSSPSPHATPSTWEDVQRGIDARVAEAARHLAEAREDDRDAGFSPPIDLVPPPVGLIRLEAALHPSSSRESSLRSSPSASAPIPVAPARSAPLASPYEVEDLLVYHALEQALLEARNNRCTSSSSSSSSTDSDDDGCATPPRRGGGVGNVDIWAKVADKLLPPRKKEHPVFITPPPHVAVDDATIDTTPPASIHDYKNNNNNDDDDDEFNSWRRRLPTRSRGAKRPDEKIRRTVYPPDLRDLPPHGHQHQKHQHLERRVLDTVGRLRDSWSALGHALGAPSVFRRTRTKSHEMTASRVSDPDDSHQIRPDWHWDVAEDLEEWWEGRLDQDRDLTRPPRAPPKSFEQRLQERLRAMQTPREARKRAERAAWVSLREEARTRDLSGPHPFRTPPPISSDPADDTTLTRDVKRLTRILRDARKAQDATTQAQLLRSLGRPYVRPAFVRESSACGVGGAVGGDDEAWTKSETDVSSSILRPFLVPAPLPMAAAFNRWTTTMTMNTTTNISTTPDHPVMSSRGGTRTTTTTATGSPHTSASPASLDALEGPRSSAPDSPVSSAGDAVSRLRGGGEGSGWGSSTGSVLSSVAVPSPASVSSAQGPPKSTSDCHSWSVSAGQSSLRWAARIAALEL